MEGWDNTIDSIVIGNKTYTENNWQQMPELNSIDEEYPWSMVIQKDGMKIIVYRNNEEELTTWLKKNGYNKLAKAFKDTMKIREGFGLLLKSGCFENKPFRRWFYEVQIQDRDCRHLPEEEEPGCHYMFSVSPPPADNNRPLSNSKHTNDSVQYLNLSYVPRPGGVPAHWNRQIRSLEICGGGAGAVLYMGTDHKTPARFFAGDPAGLVDIIYLQNDLDTFINAQSLQDAGHI